MLTTLIVLGSLMYTALAVYFLKDNHVGLGLSMTVIAGLMLHFAIITAVGG